MTDHTPTPWMSEPVPAGRSPKTHVPKIYQAVPSGFAVCQLFDKYGEPFIDAEANAAFILKAVNNHDALVKALHKATNWMLCDNEFGDPEQFKTDLAEIKALLGAVGDAGTT